MTRSTLPLVIPPRLFPLLPLVPFSVYLKMMPTPMRKLCEVLPSPWVGL